MADIRIYTGRKCGWAIRNYCALIEKRIPFETVPSVGAHGNKLPEFLRVSPFGHTPVLVHGDTSVFDSVLINEYIEDRFPDPPLLPDAAEDRIESQLWSRFCETGLIAPLGRLARGIATTTHAEPRQEFVSSLSWFVRNVIERRWRGPFFFGEQFSLLDIAFVTYFRVTGMMASALDGLDGLADERMQRWNASISARESIRRAQQIQRDLTF